jgi:hypothetical protein
MCSATFETDTQFSSHPYHRERRQPTLYRICRRHAPWSISNGPSKGVANKPALSDDLEQVNVPGSRASPSFQGDALKLCSGQLNSFRREPGTVSFVAPKLALSIKALASVTPLLSVPGEERIYQLASSMYCKGQACFVCAFHVKRLSDLSLNASIMGVWLSRATPESKSQLCL